MGEMTNADRAARAEAAILAYIDETGDVRTANGIDTWVSDLMCDLRHLADAMRFTFCPDDGEMNHACEVEEDEAGSWAPEFDGWYIEGTPRYTVRVDGNPESDCTLAAFFDANDGSLSYDEREAIKDALQRGETYAQPAGASAAWSLARVDD